MSDSRFDEPAEAKPPPGVGEPGGPRRNPAAAVLVDPREVEKANNRYPWELYADVRAAKRAEWAKEKAGFSTASGSIQVTPSSIFADGRIACKVCGGMYKSGIGMNRHMTTHRADSNISAT